MFFAGNGLVQLDPGHHHGLVASGRTVWPLGIGYLHFHNKPFDKLLRDARQKLRGRTDLTDPAAIRALRGPGEHLVPYFDLDEQGYLASFREHETFDFPEFRRLLASLDADAGIRRVWAAGAPALASPLRIDPEFDPALYVQANPDVHRADVPALLHFWKHGRREGRPLRPASDAQRRPTGPAPARRKDTPVLPHQRMPVPYTR